MVNFDLLGIQGMKSAFLQRHVQHDSGPVFNAVVCATDLEHLDPAIAFEMHNATMQRNQDFGDSPIAGVIDTELSIRLELDEP